MNTNESKKNIKFEDRTSEITPDELRELDTFKNYSDEQAKQLIDAVKSFVRIVYNLSAKEEGGTIIATKPIAINISEQLNTAA